MSRLNARIDRLEQSVGLGSTDITIFVDFIGGNLRSIRVGAITVSRPTGEAEPEFISRMRAKFRQTVGRNAVLLIGDRN